MWVHNGRFASSDQCARVLVDVSNGNEWRNVEDGATWNVRGGMKEEINEFLDVIVDRDLDYYEIKNTTEHTYLVLMIVYEMRLSMS